MFFAGVDWADQHHDVAVLDQAGQLVDSTRVSHSPAGLAQLKAFLLHIAGSPQQIPCFVETNHGLLISSLLEAGFLVYPVNPKTVDRRRKPSGAKTDMWRRWWKGHPTSGLSESSRLAMVRSLAYERDL
jgi:hypothetical protein